MKAHYIYPLVFLGLSCPLAAQAQDLNEWFKFDAFGTVGMYRGNSDIAGVRTDQKQSIYSLKDWRFDGDSQASAQLTVNPTGSFKGVLQLISKKDVKGSNQPTVEWAYLAYSPISEVDLKVGRTVAPIFLMSDYRNLNYAQTMARPQSETYQVNPITYQDGVTARWDKKIGGGNLQLEGFWGKTKVSVAGGDVDLKRVKGLSLKWAQDDWSVRGGYSWYDASLIAPGVEANIKGLMAIPTVACTNCASVIAAAASRSNIVATIATMGAAYDNGEWIAQAEWAKRDVNTVIITSVTGWNVLGARRIGDFTPYLGYGRYTVNSDKLTLAPGPYAPLALKVQLNYLNNSYMGTGDPSRSVMSAGVRWDFAKNLALKAQLESMKMNSPMVGASTGYQTYPTSMLGVPSKFDGRVSMFTLNLDFVF